MAKNHETVEGKTTIGPDSLGRYYYKAKDGKGFLNLKSPLSEEELELYVEITKAEFDQLTYVEPHVDTPEEIAAREKANEIASLKRELAATDYVVIKIAESDDAEEIAALREEYASVIAARKAKRARINELLGE